MEFQESASGGGWKQMEAQMLRRRDVERLTGLHKSTLYRMVHRGEFPAPLRLGRRAVAWRRAEIEEWLDSRERSLGEGAVVETPVEVDAEQLGLFAKRVQPADGGELTVQDAWEAWCEQLGAERDARVVGGIERYAFTGRLRRLITDLPLVGSVRVDGKVQRGWRGWTLAV